MTIVRIISRFHHQIFRSRSSLTTHCKMFPREEAGCQALLVVVPVILIVAVVEVLGVVDAREEGGGLFGKATDNSTAGRVDTAVLEPNPHALGVFDWRNTFSLEHQELSKELISAGNAASVSAAFGQQLDSCWSNARNLIQLPRDWVGLPLIHFLVRDSRAVGVVSLWFLFRSDIKKKNELAGITCIKQKGGFDTDGFRVNP
jgi:hypothetical protein